MSASKEQRFDPVLLVITGSIFAVLIFMSYLLFSLLSVVAISVGAAVVIYQVLSLRGKMASKFKYGAKFPSAYLFFLIGAPIGLGIAVGYDTYSVQESIVKAILLWGLTLTFWSTLLF
ncbi:MAG TPA: glycosyl transferase, partial [Candidatus Nitrosotalea sp.]|nr:glycosyl transferase [Candidatus Nitrosotalea sp.]